MSKKTPKTPAQAVPKAVPTSTKGMYSNKTLKAARQDEVFAAMEDIVKIEHLQPLSNAMAYVRFAEDLGEVFNIYIDNTWPAAINTLKLHEYGHIFFTHMKAAAQKQRAIEKAVVDNWTEISRHFDEDVSIESASKYLGYKLNNILMDYEVNSKLMTREEYDTFSYIVDDLQLAKAEEKGGEYLEKMVDAKNQCKNGDHLTQMCWPEDSNFPVGLDYEAYVYLALKNFDQFVDNSIAQMGVPEKMQLDGGKITSGMVKKGTSGIPVEIAKEGDQRDEETKEGRGKDQENSEEAEEPKEDESDGWSRKGYSANPSIVVEGQEIPDIKKFILKHAFAKAKTFQVPDNMYNINRKKYATNVVIPKIRKLERTDMSNVVVIVDVSGSVNRTLVENVLASIKKMRGMFNPRKSRIISWDTRLACDSAWKDMQLKYSGGGTDIAEAIKYVGKYIRKDKDKLFVISDFYDDIPDWFKALQHVHCGKYAVCALDRNNDSSAIKENGWDRAGFDEVLAYQTNCA